MDRSKSFLRFATASLLTCSLSVAFLVVPMYAQPTVKSQLANFPLGASIEVMLKIDTKKLRGARGADSETGFTLLDSKTGARQLTFDEVASVKPYAQKSHAGRNVLIGVTATLAGVGIFFLVLISRL